MGDFPTLNFSFFCGCIWEYHPTNLVGGLEHFYFPFHIWDNPSPYFSRWLKPPTSYCWVYHMVALHHKIFVFGLGTLFRRGGLTTNHQPSPPTPPPRRCSRRQSWLMALCFPLDAWWIRATTDITSWNGSDFRTVTWKNGPVGWAARCRGTTVVASLGGQAG